MFAVKPELLQVIANYLSERPWKEVAPILAELAKLKPASTPAEPTPAPTASAADTVGN